MAKAHLFKWNIFVKYLFETQKDWLTQINAWNSWGWLSWGRMWNLEFSSGSSVRLGWAGLQCWAPAWGWASTQGSSIGLDWGWTGTGLGLGWGWVGAEPGAWNSALAPVQVRRTQWLGSSLLSKVWICRKLKSKVELRIEPKCSDRGCKHTSASFLFFRRDFSFVFHSEQPNL